MTDVTVVCYLWKGNRAYYPAHVNALERGIRQHLPGARFVCIADGFNMTDGLFAPEVNLIPTPDTLLRIGALKSPHGDRYPASYRRLWTFSREARDVLGEHVLQLDVDCIPTASLWPLLDQAAGETFCGWRPRSLWGAPNRIAGGTYYVKPGGCRHVWDDFVADPGKVIAAATAANWKGSDQAIMSHLLQGHRAWRDPHGIYQAQDMRGYSGNVAWPLPADARLVHFNGERKPWDVLHWPWVREHYGAGEL